MTRCRASPCPSSKSKWRKNSPRTEARKPAAPAARSRGLFMNMGSDYVIENNIFEHLPLPISISGPRGTVVAYNFTTDSAYVPYPNIMMPGLSTEGGYTALCLFEGNYTNAIAMDNNH